MVETGKKWKKLQGKNLVKTQWVFTVWSLLANPAIGTTQNTIAFTVS